MRILKNILFVSFFLVLLWEQLLYFFPTTYVTDLKGEFIAVEKPQLSLDTWLSGQFQEQFMKHYEQDLALHPLLIKLRNQTGYSLFNEINAAGIEKGKDNVLFDNGYIKTYMGEDFIGDQAIKRKVEMLAYVQAELKKRNIDLVFVMAPGKASVLPEYIPGKYDLTKKTRSNYEAFSEEFLKQNINHLNITKYFLERKATAPYPLFTKCGVHWSGYGATLAADTTFKYLEKLRKINLPDFYDAGGEESFIPRSTDADIGELTNLMVDIPSDKMYYPKIVFKTDTSKTKPNLLVIGDSFVWSWIGFYAYIPNLFNERSVFWYYNHETGWSANGNGKVLTKDLSLKNETLSRDVIMIINTEASLNNAGQFFIEQMFEMLNNEAQINANEAL